VCGVLANLDDQAAIGGAHSRGKQSGITGHHQGQRGFQPQQVAQCHESRTIGGYCLGQSRPALPFERHAVGNQVEEHRQQTGAQEHRDQTQGDQETGR
jgi:hypothetical protein